MNELYALTVRVSSTILGMAKISGPLLDRIDLHIEVPAVKFKELSSKAVGESSQQIRERVISARDIQMKRFAGRKGMYCPP